MKHNIIMTVIACGLSNLIFATVPPATNHATSLPNNTVATFQSHPLYLGIFGGGGTISGNNIQQSGTAFFSASQGGPLFVNAQGKASTDSIGIGGMHIGYQGLVWSQTLIPAIELEGYYLGGTQSGNLLNPTPRIPEHTFVDSFPMNVGVVLVNGVFTFNAIYFNKIHPYVGGGFGAGIISITGADSPQVQPPEPGVNHFNSNTDASNWTFAAQAKAGLTLDITNHWWLFAEYRFLYLAPTVYTFGATQYPTHAPTTSWAVNFDSLYSNMGILGLAYGFDA